MSQVTFDDLMPRQGQSAPAPQARQIVPRDVRFDDLMPGAGTDRSQPDRSHPDYFRGTIIPRERDGETGETSWAVPRILDPVISAVTAPGEAMRGELQVMDEQGNVTPEAIARAGDTAIAFPSASTGLMRPRSVGVGGAGTAVRATRTIETPLQAAARRQQVRLPRAATTERPIVANLARRTSDLPGVGQPLRAASHRAVQETGEAASRIVDDLGRGDVVSAGTAITDDITRHAGRGSESTLGRRVSRLYDDVDNLIDDTVQSPLRATARVAQTINQRRQTAALPGPSAAVQQVRPALDRGSLSYNGIKDLRTFFREALDNPQQLISMGMAKGEAQAIYRALSDDLRHATRLAGGPQALRAFERANRYAQVAAREREILQSILGKGVERSPENIISRLRQLAGGTGAAGISKLTRVRRAVSRETWDEFGSSILAQLGRNPQTGDFSAARFLSGWGQLSARGRSALFPNTTVRQSIDDLVLISQRFKRLDELGNFSNSGSLGTMAAAFAGGVIAPVQTLLALIPPAAFAYVMSRPSQARKVVLWARAYEQAVLRPTAQASRILAQRSQSLAIILARETGTPNAVMQLASDLQNVPTYAEGDDQPEGVNTENRTE